MVCKVPIWSFCISIEVKSHSLFNFEGFQTVRFVDNKVDVWYKRDQAFSSATLQANGQAKSFAKRLRRETNTYIWVTPFVWLYNVSEPELHGHLNEPNNTLPRLFDIAGLGQKILDNDNPKKIYDGSFRSSIWVKDLDFEKCCIHLTAQSAVTPLNRRMIDNIVKRRIDFKQFESLGKQQQLISGRAGSGKTMVLLRTALSLFEMGKRVTILTYNKTLVADVQRLLMFLDVKGSSEHANINIMTLHSFFIAVIQQIFPEETVTDGDWLDNFYKIKVQESVDYLKTGATTREEVRQGLVAQNFSVFDFACVDEGQDWQDAERDLLHLLISSECCIVASGTDQLVRQDTICDWTVSQKVDTGTTTLRKCMRLKSAIATFANLTAKELGLSDWAVDLDDEAVGGHIVICVGDFFAYPQILSTLVDSNSRDGNKNLDMLFCVEPGNIDWLDGRPRGSKVAAALTQRGNFVWDASINANRDDPPRSVDEFRVVQFESCRGLEGWIVVAEHLDTFFSKKAASFRPPTTMQQAFFNNDKDSANAVASKWAMIPLTRAIDTLVITIKDPRSTFGRAVLEVASKMRETVEVYRS